MVKLEHSIMIRERPQVVWSFLSNLPVSQVCRRGRRSFEWIDSPKPAVGSGYTTQMRLFGIGYIQEGKITRWEPPGSFALTLWNQRHPRIGFTHQLRYAIDRNESQAYTSILHCTVIGNYRPKLVELVFKEIYRRSMIDHLVLLKQAIEATDKNGHAVRPATQRIAEASAVGG
jgi:hypothetical protein